MKVSVVIPTHNPERGRLARTCSALASQTLPAGDWELVVVDNASDPSAAPAAELVRTAHRDGRIVREAQLGLSHARRAGLAATTAELIVFVDDDNVLAPDFLAQAVDLFARRPRLGAAGGPCRPEYAVPPPDWLAPHSALLALRDHGPAERFASGCHEYPAGCAPIGAGMVLRREALASWLAERGSPFLDRTGTSLTSAGDNHLVLQILRDGWEVGYVPELAVTHLIPAARLEPDYLARLARAMSRSWMHLLTHHGINPWPPLSRAAVWLRLVRAWLRHQPWRGPSARIDWNASRGHFEGRLRP